MRDETDDRIARLSPEKRAILQRKLMAARAARVDADLIPVRQKSHACALSYAQELLWLLDQLTAGSNAAYNVPRALRLSGTLDIAALQKSLDAIVLRHEVLRTTYALRGEGPVQLVTDAQGANLRVIDLAGLDDDAQDAEVKRLLVDEARYHFDLTSDLMLRSTLIRQSDREHVLLMVTHHIASDGWSREILFRELVEHYGAFARGQQPNVEPLRIQYADFAAWQRKELDGEEMTRELDYWLKQLEGAPASLELPTDRPRPSAQSFRGARRPMLFPRALVDELQKLSRAEGATLFMTLMAAFQVLLHRYTGQDDIVVGTPIAGRDRVEVEPLIGYFTNTLAMRTKLDGDPTFRELLARVREVALGAFAHQSLPFEKLVVTLNPERTLSHTPIFQVMFTAGNASAAGLELPDLVLTPLRTDRGTAKFDLTLGLTERPEGMTGTFEYSTDLFDAPTIDRMIAHLRNLLEAIVANPDERISATSLLDDIERKQVLVDWNATASEFPRNLGLHGLFEAQAKRTPDGVAVEGMGRSLTYAQLDGRADGLAERLRALGIKSGMPVAVCMDRRPETAVALLGTLKAGGACVPLDPNYPCERLAWMLRDSRASVVLTRSSLVDRLPPGVAEIICLDDDSVIDGKVIGPADKIRPADGAYVLYTSGSTGVPKGVLLTHEGLVNHATAAIALYGLSSSDRVLQFASPSFDIAVEEMFPTWAAGGTVVFRPDDLPMGGVEFDNWIAAERISVLDLPTAFWHEWTTDLAERGASAPATLRLVIVGGEKASPEVYAKWQRVAPNVRWINTYGPTEASVIVTASEPASSGDEQMLPIGRPVQNVQAYVLDKRFDPVPIGVTGDLYVAGECLARGYIDQPALTAERFMPNPFAERPGSRMYRTGDRARWRSDGVLEYQGRTDHQVKIRGFRVEPGEIEACLRALPTIRAAAVVAFAEPRGGLSLAAYVVASDLARAEDVEPATLKKYLRDRLPDYMVPATITRLASLPLTPNGKLDRKALVRPAAAESVAVAPRTPVEEIVASVWADVLGIERIGATDDFFDLGGHSLRATLVISRLKALLGVDLPLRSLFEGPTVAEMATAVERELASIGEEMTDL